MINFRQLFGIDDGASAPALGSLFAELEKLLEQYSNEEVEFIAGYSGLLGKIAYSDRRILLEEIVEIKKILTEVSSLSSEMYDAVIELVSKYTTELSGIEDQVYIQIINANCSQAQKVEVLRGLFAVAAADRTVDIDEDRDIAVIAKGLFVPDENFIAVRREFKEHLAILRKKS